MLSIYALFILFRIPCFSFLFFFNDTATTEIYTLSLHDALPISYEVAADFLADAFGGLFAGQQIGPYKIISPLAAGGMGEVYLAQDSRLGRKIALKLLPPDFAKDQHRVRRSAQEARAAAALNHPNGRGIQEVGKTSRGRHFIAV